MKILHFLPTYFPASRYGGPLFALRGLSKAQQSLGHEVCIFTTNVNGGQNSEVPLNEEVPVDGVPVVYFPVKGVRRLYYSPEMMRVLHQRIFEFDFIHIHSIFNFFSYFAGKIAQENDIPYCVSPRGSLVPELVKKKNAVLKHVWLKCFDGSLLGRSAFIHTTSLNETESIGEFNLKLRQICQVPNGVEKVASLDSGRQTQPGGDYLLFLGRLSWKKSLDRLICALSHIQEIDLVIAGQDDEGLTPHLMRLAKKLDVEDRVKMVGPVYGEDKQRLIGNSKVLVMASVNENFGNVVLEALACGRPVAVTRGVGASDIVEKHGVGWILDDLASQMGAKINEIIADDEELNRRGALGKALIENRYSWRSIAEQLVANYEQTIGQRWR